MRRDLERRAITLERKLRRLAALRSTTVPRRASDLGSTPDFGALRIVYFAAGPRLCALVQRGESWSLIENLAHVEDVDAAVRLLLYQMAARPRTSGSPVRDDVLASRVRGHLDRIGRMVLDPVLDSGPPPPRICIQPHGSLARVPFAALSWRGRPLVWGSDLALEFGATPETEPRRRDRALVVGYSELEVDHVEREAIGVGRTLREAGCPAHVLLGSQSSFAAICEGVRTVTHLHLSGHAIYRSEHPEFSAMRVADGWLHAVDLAGLPLDGVTVVLSACETGPRGVVSGDEVLGMVRACMRAGARTIVASLWRVDGAAAQRFMQQLYREWQRRGMLGAALGAVQRQASRTGDPYHWAAFCLVGDPASPWPGILQPQRTERRKMEEAHARV